MLVLVSAIMPMALFRFLSCACCIVYLMTEAQPTNRFCFLVFATSLIFPVLLLADVVSGQVLNGAPVGSGKAFLASSLWLVASIGAMFAWRHRPLRLLQLAVGVYATVAAIAISEIAIRTLSVRYLRPPNSQMSFSVDSNVLPGVSGVKTFTVNSLGLRGPELPRTRSYRIIAIGGSTTECMELDDREQWTQLLMDHLPGHKAWVANAGQSGRTSVDSILEVRSIPALQLADAWIFLEGINDLRDTIEKEGRPTESELEVAANNRIHDGMPPRPFFGRLRLYQLLRNALLRATQFGKTNSDVSIAESRRMMEFFQDCRALRALSPIAPLPDLSIGLKEYRQRIGALADECKAGRKRCIFLTQPGIWHDDMSPQELKLLWFGRVGDEYRPRGYVRPEQMASAMHAYNDVLLDVCRLRALECYDLAAAVPPSPEFFFDDVHFNERGARQVADFLSERLSRVPPFTSSDDHSGR